MSEEGGESRGERGRVRGGQRAQARIRTDREVEA